MKKIFLCFIMLIIVIIIILAVKISDNNMKANTVKTYNQIFEEYKNKTLYGADVTTIINKAIDNNNESNIQKGDDGYYINDSENSLQVDLILLNLDKEGNVYEQTFKMEDLQKVGLDGFISSFSIVPFECTSIEYHSNRKNK